jgi:O-antigen/teichoic acid export membrane protein
MSLTDITAGYPDNSAPIAGGGAPGDGVAPPRFSSKRAYAGTFTATFAICCAGVLTGVLAARLLGPTGRGELAVIIFLPVLLVPLAEFELPRSIAYSVSKREQAHGELVATSFWLAVVLGCIQAILLVFALPFFLPAGKFYLLSTARWFVLYLPAIYITLFLTGIDQGVGRFGRFGIFQALPGILYLVAVLVACVIGAISPVGFALAMLCGAVATAILRIAVDWKAILHSRPRWRTASSLLGRGFSFYIPAVAGFALMRADTFLVVQLTTTEAIGLYAIAQAIAMGQIGAVNPFVQVVFAAVAGETDQQRALQTLAHHFRLAQWAVLSVGLVAVGLTPWAIPLLFGAKFSAATTTAYLLIAASVPWGMSQVLEQGLRAASHPRPGIVSNLLGLGVLFALGIPACVRFGIVGLAASLTAAQFINLAALIAFCVVLLKMPLSSLWAFRSAAVRELAISARPFLNRVRS